MVKNASRKRELLMALGLVFGTIAIVTVFLILVVKPCVPCQISNWDKIQQKLQENQEK